MNTPLASIIITSYNYGRFLREAIDNALRQTYPRTEVIVVDDGSTDDSRAIIESYGSSIVPILKTNGGQASAMNAGFQASRGDVVLFLDSDDVLFPTALEKSIPLLRNQAIVKVHWAVWKVDPEGNRTSDVFPTAPLAEGNLRDAVLRAGPEGYAWPPTSGNLWPRWFLEAVLPIPEAEFTTSPDLYLSALAPLFGTIRRLPEPQGIWRHHGENNSWREPFDTRLREMLRRTDCCLSALIQQARARGIAVDAEQLRANSWWHQIRLAVEDIRSVVPERDTFILVDEDQWGAGNLIAGRRKLPFLERDGQYWGMPADDAVAIEELERLRQAGASFIGFWWPESWWLDHFTGLHRHLRACYRCVRENNRLVLFDLRDH